MVTGHPPRWMALMCGLGLVGCNEKINAPLPGDLAVAEVVSGLQSPVHLTAPPGDTRLFVIEQAGIIRIIENGQIRTPAFLDIRSLVGSGGERGLLSMAFHPDYADNGEFFVNYTDTNGDTRVARYLVSSDPNVADGSSAEIILTVAQPFSNHNGGHILFGPDGMLYIAMGDGGSANDPNGHGQNTTTLLGALLRIDVDGGTPYAIPNNNPFGNEIWAYGLRNPWRIALDRANGLLYIADVGQNRREEVNVAPISRPSVNYGWNIMEGSQCFQPSSGCQTEGLTLPVLDYDHGEGCSITGGIVYGGNAVPGVRGHYFYSDFCGGWLRSFRFVDGAAVDRTEWDVGDLGSVTSFGEGGDGELYILAAGGRIVRLVQEGQ